MKSSLYLVIITLFVVTGCDNSKYTHEGCNVDNPLVDFPWLKEIVVGFESDSKALGYNPHARIYQCSYKDGICFLLEMCVDCPDAEYNFLNCKGNFLCSGGGKSGGDNCLGINIDMKNKKLIWEMEKTTKQQPQELCHCIMDTLKGEWTWIKKDGGFAGYITNNEFKSTIRILGQNEDASINYEVFVEDTLFFKDNFQMGDSYIGKVKIARLKLPHWTPAQKWGSPHQIWDWYVSFGDRLVEETSENTLCFWNGTYDDYFYYYQKLKKEE